MNEHDKARPVSGEIMAGAASRPDAAGRRDFTDAEYEVVGNGQPRRSEHFPPRKPVAGLDTLRLATPVPEAPRKSGGPLFWAFALTLVILVFWISGGHEVVRNVMLPPQGQAQAALRITNVASRIETHEGRGILFVEGQAENGGSSAATLPAIEIAVIGNDGRTTRYFLGTKGSQLAPGGSYAFSSRLEAPRNGVKTVSVAFQEEPR